MSSQIHILQDLKLQKELHSENPNALSSPFKPSAGERAVQKEISADMSHPALETSGMSAAAESDATEINQDKSVLISLLENNGEQPGEDASTMNINANAQQAKNHRNQANKKFNLGPIEELFILKCRLCSVIFSMEVNDAFFEAREAKRGTLLELIELMDGEKQTEPSVTVARLELLKSDKALTQLFRMISINLFRTPKVSVTKFGGQQEDKFNTKAGDEIEETQILLEEQWPHLQIIYELLLRVVIFKNFTLQSIGSKFINHSFVAHLLDLFRSPDPRERDYLKTVVHRIYGKFMPLRFGIRMTIVRELVMECMKETSESSTDRVYGIAEYLEMLVPIIEGFNE